MQVGYGLLGLPDFVAVAHTRGETTEARLLHPEEAAYVSARAVESRRRDYAIGREAAHRALGLLAKDEGPIRRGRHGEPLWPDGVVGSITHAAGQVVAAVAGTNDASGIGVDTENVARFFDGLIDYVAFGEEAERLRRLPATEQDRATMELFSAKEAIYKAFFPTVGEFFGFAAAEVRPSEDGYAGRLLEPLDPDYPADRTFPCTGIARKGRACPFPRLPCLMPHTPAPSWCWACR